MNLSSSEKDILSKLSKIAEQKFAENTLKLSVEIPVDDYVANHEELKELAKKIFYSKIESESIGSLLEIWRPLIVFNDFRNTIKLNINTIKEALSV